MLNAITEKQNSERLIFKNEISMKSTACSPFESTDDIVLSGSFSELLKNEVLFRSRSETSSAHENDEFVVNLRENQIRNALRDLAKSPSNPFLLNNLGLAKLGSGKIDDALRLFIKAIESKPDFAIAKLNLASVYLLKNEYGLALQIYDEILNKNPDDSRALINVGDIYLKKREIEKAKEIFEKIIKKNPNNIASRNRLAIINLIQGEYGKAISELRKCLQERIDLASIYNNLGVAYGVAGSYKRAILSLKIALKLSPSYSSAIANLAIVLGQQNKIQESIELMEDFLKENENNKIRELISGFYLRNRQHKNALRNLMMVLANARRSNFPDQEIARLHNNLGVIYFSSKDFERAEGNFIVSINKAERINQIQVQNLIDLYFAMNNINKAKKYVDLLREEFKESEYYLYYMGLYSFHNGEISCAISFLKDFLNAIKQFAPSYTLLGYIYSEYLSDYREAIEVMKEGYKNIPNNIAIINNLAYSYLMNNEIQNARQVLAKVEDVADNVYLVATRGLLKIKEGNLEEGRKQYNAAAGLAEYEYLRKQVLQKKYLEIAKYCLANDNLAASRDSLIKALSIRTKGSIYSIQAKEILERLGS